MNLFKLPDHEFIMRFRLNKDSMNCVIRLIKPHLPQHTSSRGAPVPVHLQVLITLRYLATGNHQLTVLDYFDVSQPLVCRCIHRASRAIARMSRSVIKMPNNDEAPRVVEDFMAIAGMPGVIGCIACTHIAIKRPPGDQSELFRNRKGVFSLNVQAVCGPQLQFFNVAARWPGSAHDSNNKQQSLVWKWKMVFTEVVFLVMQDMLVHHFFSHQFQIPSHVKKYSITNLISPPEITLREPLEFSKDGLGFTQAKFKQTLRITKYSLSQQLFFIIWQYNGEFQFLTRLCNCS